MKYLLTNLYRIWIPLYNKIIITKDVYFNEEKIFDGNIKIFKCDVKNISWKHLINIVKNTTHRVIIIILPITYNNTVKDLKWSYKNEGNKKKIRFLENLIPAWRNKYIITVFKLLPTSPDTPLECLLITVLITAMPKDTPNKNLLSV